MIIATDLMLDNWFINPEGGYERVQVLKPFFVDEKRYCQINGRDADECSPIPLTPELMKTIRWVVSDGEKTIISLPVPVLGIRFDTYGGVWFFKEDTGEHKAGDICCGHRMRPLKYLHELQNHYRFDVGKHLEVGLAREKYEADFLKEYHESIANERKYASKNHRIYLSILIFVLIIDLINLIDSILMQRKPFMYIWMVITAGAFVLLTVYLRHMRKKVN